MRFFRDILLAGVACLGILFVLEIGLRLSHERFNASLFQAEPERGYGLRPNAEGWNVDEAEVYVHINNAGMRDRERTLQPVPGDLRIAVLGASNVEAIEVPLEQTFEQRMEQDLVPHVEVLNFGIAGHSLAQQYLTLRSRVFQFNPRIVILVWDQYLLLKNTPQTDPDGPDGYREPFFGVHNGHLEPEPLSPSMRLLQSQDPRDLARRNQMADLMNRSYLLATVNWGRFQLQKQIAALRASLRSKPAVTPTNARPADYIQWWTFKPDLPELREDWEIGEAFAREMKAECDRHGVEFYLVISDQGAQSNHDPAIRQAFMQSHGLTTLDASDERLERFCKNNGIHVLVLAPALREYATAHNVALHGSGPEDYGHWNKQGHEVVAHILIDELRTKSSVIRSWHPPLPSR